MMQQQKNNNTNTTTTYSSLTNLKSMLEAEWYQYHHHNNNNNNSFNASYANSILSIDSSSSCSPSQSLKFVGLSSSKTHVPIAEISSTIIMNMKLVMLLDPDSRHS